MTERVSVTLTRKEWFGSVAGVFAGIRGLSFAQTTSPRSGAEGSDWLRATYRELHLDAHFGQLTTAYDGFHAEAAAETLKNAGFQLISYFASCNAGYSYYPTQVGVIHPGLRHNFTGEMTRALKKRGVRVLAYVSVGPDRRYHKDHPDWIAVRNPSKPEPEVRGGMAQMCLNSPWVEEVHLRQLEEIVSLYDVDGFFLDSLLGKFTRGPCYCKYCRARFAADIGGEIPVSDTDPKVLVHHRWLLSNIGRYAEKVIAALTTKKSDLAFVFTHVWVSHSPVKPPHGVTQLVWEPVPPYSGVLSLDYSFEARYLSTLPGVANWSCMATRGNGWGDYSLRDPITFRHEAAVLLAGGGRPYLADDSYPSGNPDPAVYRVYGEVNRRTEQLESLVKGCTPVKDIAVLLSADSMWSKLLLVPPPSWIGAPSSSGVAGAHKMLVEEHAQFGIVNSEGLLESLGDYKALLVPEQSILSDKECAAIRKFVSAGGALIVTGESGMLDPDNRERSDFPLGDVLGIRYLGRNDVRRAYLRIQKQVQGLEVPLMDTQVAGPYIRVQATTGRTLLELVPPDSPKQAPRAEPEGPAVTMNVFGEGRAVYCAVPIFSAYHQDDTPSLRKLLSWMLSLAHPVASRTIALENAPNNVEVSLNERASDKFVHLVNFTGDRRLQGAQRVQDLTAVDGIVVRFRCSRPPRRVILEPEKEVVACDWRAGWASFQARPLLLHSVYRVEQ